MSQAEMQGGETGAVRVSRRAADRLRTGHLWVYRTEMEGAITDLTPGVLVRVMDGRGVDLGWGTYSASSTIAIRLLLHSGEPARESSSAPLCDVFLALVAQRVRSALDLRLELAPLSPSNTGRRLLFSEADGLPGMVADQYGSLVILQLLTQGMAQDDVRRAVAGEMQRHFLEAGKRSMPGEASAENAQAEVLSLTLWERPDPRIRELEALPPSPTEPLLVIGAEPQTEVIFHLNGLQFHFNVGAGQKTGAFLDQRLNYQAAADTVARLRGLAGPGAGRSRRALDVCTYQGGFALHLARVCERVTGVDASRAALEVADRNLELNREQMRGEVEWIEADAFELLRAFDDAGERFGAVVLDPPAFAKTRRAAESALRGYKEMNLRAIRMMEPGGVLVTCSCSHHVSEPEFREAVRSAAADAGRTVQVMESRGAAPDHPEVLSLPETRYLKCLICRVV